MVVVVSGRFDRIVEDNNEEKKTWLLNSFTLSIGLQFI